MKFNTALVLLSSLPALFAYKNVPKPEERYFNQIRPVGFEIPVRETIRQHHHGDMEQTQCGTSGRTYDVVGVDNTLFGSMRNGEKSWRCGMYLKLRFAKKDGSQKIVYGSLTDRIWQNGGVGFQSYKDMEAKAQQFGSQDWPDTRAFQFNDQVDLSEELHREIGGREGVNLDYDGQLYVTICPYAGQKC